MRPLFVNKAVANKYYPYLIPLNERDYHEVVAKGDGSKIEEMRSKHPSMGEFRNTGLLGCLDILKNKNTGELIAPYNAAGEDLKVTNLIASKVRELGLYTFVRWGYIFIAPPLCINEKQIDEGLSIISEALKIADEHLV